MKILKALTVAAVAAVLTLGGAGIANADALHVHYTPHSETVDWYAPNPATAAQPFAAAQTRAVLLTCGVKQSDTYWLATQADQKALASLQTLTSPADDAAWPHTYTLTDLPCPPVLIPVDLVPLTQTAPTCDAGSTYTVPTLPAGLKYTLNADGTRPMPGTYPLAAGQTVSIQEHSLADGYVPVSQTYTFTGADKLTGLQCAPTQPEPTVTTVDTISSPNCTTLDVTVTHTTTTTTGTAYDEASNTWVATEPVVTTTTDTRHATAGEIEASCPPVIVPPVTPPTNPTPPVVKPTPPSSTPSAPVTVPATTTATTHLKTATVHKAVPTAQAEATGTLAYTGSDSSGDWLKWAGMGVGLGIALLLWSLHDSHMRRKAASNGR